MARFPAKACSRRSPRNRVRFSGLAVLAALLTPAVALAGGAGAGVPEIGGPGAGAASADARGLYYNPAAAVGSEGTELDLDISAIALSVHYQRAGLNPRDGQPFSGADSFDVAEVPYFAVRSDSFGGSNGRPHSGKKEKGGSRFGLGMTVAAPFGRKVTYKSSFAGRYHLVAVDFFTAYAIPSVAFRVTPNFRLGAGPIIAISQYTIKQRLDLAPTLQTVSPSNPPPPAESALLEGEISIKNARAIEPGFSVGALVDIGDGLATVGAGFLSGSLSTATGKARLTPSLDFNVYSKSDVKLRKNLPPIANLGARLRPRETPIELSLEAQYVGWHVVDTDEIEISHSQIASNSADLNALLNALNVNQGTLVSGILDQKQRAKRGWRDSVNVILGAEYKYSKFRSRFEIGYDRSAIPDKNVNPGNLDFDSLVLGAASTFEPKDKPYWISVSLSQYLNQSRTIRNSGFDTYAVPSTGYAFPSGNGTYGAVLTRVAVAAGYRF